METLPTLVALALMVSLALSILGFDGSTFCYGYRHCMNFKAGLKAYLAIFRSKIRICFRASGSFRSLPACDLSRVLVYDVSDCRFFVVLFTMLALLALRAPILLVWLKFDARARTAFPVLPCAGHVA
jgi:hypothetical protein